MKLPSSFFLAAICSLTFSLGSLQAQVWSFGFENTDYTNSGGGSLVFDQTFDGITNSSALIDNAYIAATSNEFNYGGDYEVVTGFDAQEGSNFAYLSTSNVCFGFDPSAIGLVSGQEYQICFYIAALDTSLPINTSFSVSAAFDQTNGSTGIVQGTDEQGLALFNTLYTTPPYTFIDPGFSPASTTTNDKTSLTWEKYTTNFIYDPSMPSLFISGFGDDGVGSFVAIDNIAIEAVPEPSSAILCLLGAGFWTVFGRRRRQTA